jgi:hypothetical protein
MLERAAKGADGLGVIERVTEREALIEIPLRLFRRSGDGMMVITQSIKKRCDRLDGCLRLGGKTGSRKSEESRDTDRHEL